MCQQLLSRRDPNNPGQWLGPISAVHFVRYDDQRRLDPVCAVKSLVYQLAVRWVGLRSGWGCWVGRAVEAVG